MKAKAKPIIRDSGNVSRSISMTQQQLAEIDARAASLGISRSAYLLGLAAVDCERAGVYPLVPRQARPSDAPAPERVAPVQKVPVDPAVENVADTLLLRPN